MLTYIQNTSNKTTILYWRHHWENCWMSLSLKFICPQVQGPVHQDIDNIHLFMCQFVSKKDGISESTLWLQNAMQMQGVINY